MKTAITTLDDLRIEQEIASMESFLGLDAVERAARRLPGIVQGARNLLKTQRHQFKSDKPVFSPKPLRDLYRKIERHSYVNLQAVDVQVPEGLRSDLLTYVRALKPVGDVVRRLESDVLQPFETWLGQMVGDPQKLANLSNRIQVTGMQTLSFETSEKTIQNLFQTHGQRTHLVPYGQAFLRNLDLQIVSEELGELESLFGKDHQKVMFEHTTRIVNMMRDLTTILENRSQELRVSAATVRSLSDTVYHVARLLEQYGLFRYRLLELSHAMEETRVRLDTWIRKNK